MTKFARASSLRVLEPANRVFRVSEKVTLLRAIEVVLHERGHNIRIRTELNYVDMEYATIVCIDPHTRDRALLTFCAPVHRLNRDVSDLMPIQKEIMVLMIDTHTVGQ